MVLTEEVYVLKSIAKASGYFTEAELDERAWELRYVGDNIVEEVVKVRYDEFRDPSATPGYDKSKGHEISQQHGFFQRVRDQRHTQMPADKSWKFVDANGYLYTWVKTNHHADGSFKCIAHFRRPPDHRRLWQHAGTGTAVSVEHEIAIDHCEAMLKAGPVVVTTRCAGFGCNGVSQVLDFSDPRYIFRRKYRLRMMVNGVEEWFEIDLAVLNTDTEEDDHSDDYFVEIEKTHANDRKKVLGFAANYPDQNGQFGAKEVTVMRYRWEKDPENVGVELLHSDRGRRFGATQTCVVCRNRVEAERDRATREARDKKDGVIAAFLGAEKQLLDAFQGEKESEELEKLLKNCKDVGVIAVFNAGSEQEKYSKKVHRLELLVKKAKALIEAKKAVDNAVADGNSKLKEATDAASINAAKKACDAVKNCINVMVRLGKQYTEEFEELLGYTVNVQTAEPQMLKTYEVMLQHLDARKVTFAKREKRKRDREERERRTEWFE